MITPQLRFQECKTAGHTKSGAETGVADRTGSGNKCWKWERAWYNKIITRGLLKLKCKVWVTRMAPWACPQNLSFERNFYMSIVSWSSPSMAPVDPPVSQGATLDAPVNHWAWAGLSCPMGTSIGKLCSCFGCPTGWDVLRTVLRLLPQDALSFFVLLSQMFDLHWSQKVLSAYFY